MVKAGAEQSWLILCMSLYQHSTPHTFTEFSILILCPYDDIDPEHRSSTRSPSPQPGCQRATERHLFSPMLLTWHNITNVKYLRNISWERHYIICSPDVNLVVVSCHHLPVPVSQSPPLREVWMARMTVSHWQRMMASVKMMENQTAIMEMITSQ